ncbi:MAG: hypothetical protein AAGG51_12060 [Cyanobacteria bacterium P01_G01_bin.54]
MRLIIGKSVNEEYTSPNLERIGELISQVEIGVIQRPEIELIDNDIGVELHLGLLFAKDSLAGWLVTQMSKTNPPYYTICKYKGTNSFVEGLVYCGAPENVINSAILQRAEVLEVIDFFFREGKCPKNYILRQRKEIFSRYQDYV